jgi:hypothetical protein
MLVESPRFELFLWNLKAKLKSTAAMPPPLYFRSNFEFIYITDIDYSRKFVHGLCLAGTWHPIVDYYVNNGEQANNNCPK